MLSGPHSQKRARPRTADEEHGLQIWSKSRFSSLGGWKVPKNYHSKNQHVTKYYKGYKYSGFVKQQYNLEFHKRWESS